MTLGQDFLSLSPGLEFWASKCPLGDLKSSPYFQGSDLFLNIPWRDTLRDMKRNPVQPETQSLETIEMLSLSSVLSPPIKTCPLELEWLRLANTCAGSQGLPSWIQCLGYYWDISENAYSREFLPQGFLALKVIRLAAVFQVSNSMQCL